MKISNYEEKAFIDVFLQKIKDILRLTSFRPVINNAIAEQYTTALRKLDDKLDLTINLVPKTRDLTFLQDYVNDNIQAAADTIANDLRQEIQRGILNGDDTTALSRRVRSLFKERKYATRLKTILRTETLRANNQGTLEGAKQAQDTGLKLEKWLDVIIDDTSTDICNHGNKDSAFNKYGTPEQSIPIDEEFIMKANNKTIRGQIPPFHVNCRTVLRIKVIK